MPARESLLIGIMWRIYRACLRAAPRRFRERFGGEADDAFRSLVAATAGERGGSAALLVAIAACADVFRTGVNERRRLWATSVFSGIGGDVRHGMRVYWREPLVAFAIVLTMGLAAGPSAAVGSGLSGFMPCPDPRLVVLYAGGGDRS
jgi:hypothetical protein